MGQKSVDYAEVTLGVHTSYETAKDAWFRLEGARAELLGMRGTKRSIDNAITDRESDIAADVTAALGGAGQSQAAIDRQIKLQIGTDPEIRRLRQELLDQLTDIDGEEANAALAKAQVEIETGRMIELGGYLQYLAATKRAASTTGAVSQPSVELPVV